MQITEVDIAIIIDISKCGLSGLAARTSTSCCRALRRMDNQCWRTLSRVQSPVGAQIIIIIITFCQYQPRERGDTRYQLSYNEAYLPTLHRIRLGIPFCGDSYNTHSTLPMLQVFRRRGEGREMEDKNISGYCVLNHLLDQQRRLQIFLD